MTWKDWESLNRTVTDTYYSELCKKIQNDDKMKITIRLEGSTFMTLKRSLRVSFTDKLGSVGGTFGLFSGFSLLAIVELMHWICMIAHSFLRSRQWRKSRRMGKELFLTAWWLPDACLKIDRQLPTKCMSTTEDCLTTSWWLLDNCLMTVWQLSDICLMTAWWVLDNRMKTAWQMPDKCLTNAWQMPEGWQLQEDLLLTLDCF